MLSKIARKARFQLERPPINVCRASEDRLQASGREVLGQAFTFRLCLCHYSAILMPLPHCAGKDSEEARKCALEPMSP